MKKPVILFLTSIFIIIAVGAYADEDPVEYKFAKSYIESLRYLKKNHLQAGSLPNPEDFANENDYLAAVRNKMIYSRDRLVKAKTLIHEYAESENPLIADTARNILFSYEAQIETLETNLEMVDKLAASPLEPSGEERVFEKINQRRAITEEAVMVLSQCSVLVAHALVNQVPDNHGRLSRLVITSGQRKELVALLDDIFGEEIKDGVTEGQFYLDSCGAILRQVLAGKYKSAEER